MTLFWSKRQVMDWGRGREVPAPLLVSGRRRKTPSPLGVVGDRPEHFPANFPSPTTVWGSQGAPGLFAVVVHHRLGFSVRGPQKALVGSIGLLGDSLSALGKAVTFQQPMKNQTVN